MAKKKKKSGDAVQPNAVLGDIEILNFVLRVLYNHDCKKLANELLERFGSFGGVLKATQEELQGMGLTARAATFFTSLRPMFRQALLRSVKKTAISGEQAAATYCVAFFMNKDRECDYCLYLDKRGRISRAERLVEVDRVREIAGNAARYSADRIALLSYKPFGAALGPDRQRLALLAEVIRPLTIMNIVLVDYIEYAPFEFYSLRRAAAGTPAVFDIDGASSAKYACKNNDALAEYVTRNAKTR